MTALRKTLATIDDNTCGIVYNPIYFRQKILFFLFLSQTSSSSVYIKNQSLKPYFLIAFGNDVSDIEVDEKQVDFSLQNAIIIKIMTIYIHFFIQMEMLFLSAWILLK